MAGFEAIKGELDDAGVAILAASVDPVEKAAEVQEGLSFPIAHGVTKEQADTIGSWWEERRAIIQPSEFVLDSDGKVLSATYSTGPIGRLDAGDALKLISFIDKQRQSQQ